MRNLFDEERIVDVLVGRNGAYVHSRWVDYSVYAIATAGAIAGVLFGQARFLGDPLEWPGGLDPVLIYYWLPSLAAGLIVRWAGGARLGWRIAAVSVALLPEGLLILQGFTLTSLLTTLIVPAIRVAMVGAYVVIDTRRPNAKVAAEA